MSTRVFAFAANPLTSPPGTVTPTGGSAPPTCPPGQKFDISVQHCVPIGGPPGPGGPGFPPAPPRQQPPGPPRPPQGGGGGNNQFPNIPDCKAFGNDPRCKNLPPGVDPGKGPFKGHTGGGQRVKPGSDFDDFVIRRHIFIDRDDDDCREHNDRNYYFVEDEGRFFWIDDVDHIRMFVRCFRPTIYIAVPTISMAVVQGTIASTQYTGGAADTAPATGATQAANSASQGIFGANISPTTIIIIAAVFFMVIMMMGMGKK